MNPVFDLTIFPAAEGDCLLLSWGGDRDTLHYALIDGGRTGTWKHLKPALGLIASNGRPLELLVLSHIDADHIDGLNRMLDDGSPIAPKRVWFNGFDQLRRLDPPTGFSPSGFAGADRYSMSLADAGWPINADFRGLPVMLETFPERFEIEGLSLKLLSPDRRKLAALKAEWDKWRNGQDDAGTGLAPSGQEPGGFAPAGIRPMPEVLDVDRLCGPSPVDESAPNGSSIAMIAEFGGRRVLFGADAHPDLLEKALAAVAGDEGKVKLDLFKLAHHGSRANLTRAILESLDCSRFAISTNGSRFGHPDPEAIARILKFGGERDGGKTLYFNYASARTRPWNDEGLRQRWNFDCRYPENDEEPLVVSI